MYFKYNFNILCTSCSIVGRFLSMQGNGKLQSYHSQNVSASVKITMVVSFSKMNLYHGQMVLYVWVLRTPLSADAFTLHSYAVFFTIIDYKSNYTTCCQQGGRFYCTRQEMEQLLVVFFRTTNYFAPDISPLEHT